MLRGGPAPRAASAASTAGARSRNGGARPVVAAAGASAASAPTTTPPLFAAHGPRRRHARVVAAPAAAAAAAAVPPSGEGGAWQDPSAPSSSSSSTSRRGSASASAASATPSSPPAQSETVLRYPRTAAAFSPCARNDGACHELEGVVQNVLGFPRLPPRLHRALAEGRLTPWNGAAHAAAAEHLCGCYGRELALVYVNRCPRLLEQPPAELNARAEALVALLQLPPSPPASSPPSAAAAATPLLASPLLPALLRKSPELLAQSAEVTRLNYASLARSLAQPPLSFGAQRCRAVASKYPVALAKPAASIARALAALRRLCASREAWSRDLADATPSLIAFFLADAGGGLRRLEFLSATGAGRALTLREVLKPGDAGFSRRHPQFPRWLKAVRARRDELRAAALRAELQQGAATGSDQSEEEEEEEEEEEAGFGGRSQDEEEDAEALPPRGGRRGGAQRSSSSSSRFDESMLT